jgi:exopolysaccharide biosynthesis WecB/TagA/CpsF family protein
VIQLDNAAVAMHPFSTSQRNLAVGQPPVFRRPAPGPSLRLVPPSAAAADAQVVPCRRLLGLDFADLDVVSAARLIAERPAERPFAYVVTPNADHLVRLSRDASLPPLYADAMLRLLDSRVVAHAARLLGLRPPTVTTGSDLTARLLEAHLRPGQRVTIIGLREHDLAALVKRTGIAPPAHHEPPMNLDRDPAAMARAVRFVLDHPAQFVFLAVGSPRQERLAAAIQATGAATGIGLCVGASLEFVAGTLPRAPRFMQLAGLEWLHRMALNPRRLARRYLIDNPPIFRLLWRERREMAKRRS